MPIYNTACFLGHRTINESEELKEKLRDTIEHLITVEKIDTFLFGSKSMFNTLCLKTVTQMKERYPHIKLIYVRAEYPFINDSYKEYLLKSYDDTYYPENILKAGNAVYIERNREMIKNSRFCIVYFDKNQSLKQKSSGTKIALEFAIKKKKSIIHLAN